MTSPSDETLPKHTPLQRFRAKTFRQNIHRQELLLVWVVAGQLVFLPWALGGMPLWSQLVSLALSIAAIICALLPRNYDHVTAPGQAPFRLFTLPKLTRFPVFWLGLAFLGYIAVQALNPAWIYDTDGKGWWMQATEPIRWLPGGVDVPFARGGPWRMLIIYISVWLTVCAVWIGFTRRRSLQVLFSALAINAFLLAGLGIAERGLGADKIFWLWKPPASYFVSSFIYKNHAGAYFNLLLSLCVGLAYWHYERSERRLDKSSPSGLFSFFGTAVALIVCFSYSRTATLLMFAFLIALLAVFLWRHFNRPVGSEKNLLIVFVVLCVLGGFISIGMKSLRIGTVVERMSELRNQIEETTPGSRTLAASATWDMAKSELIAGSGAGSFRFLFPLYSQQYPEIFKNGAGQRYYWEHAHNDYLEGLAEFGLIGMSFVAACLGYALIRMLKTSAWKNPLALCVLGGIAVTLAHGTVDFNFYNPAVLTTWSVLLFGILRWVEVEDLAIRS